LPASASIPAYLQADPEPSSQGQHTGHITMTGDQPKVRQNIMLTERLLAHNLFRPEGGIEILSILFY